MSLKNRELHELPYTEMVKLDSPQDSGRYFYFRHPFTNHGRMVSSRAKNLLIRSFCSNQMSETVSNSLRWLKTNEQL